MQSTHTRGPYGRETFRQNSKGLFTLRPRFYAPKIFHSRQGVTWLRGKEVVFSDGAGFEPRVSEEDALSTQCIHSKYLYVVTIISLYKHGG